ncbi:hypothetical protein HELRODRAFT_62386, partial [Helobdella robusta]|uniref:SET domain-containing protein n=1 Tax=Helobdella robusta TaxID=6412 RepID=T1FX00_HELRO
KYAATKCFQTDWKGWGLQADEDMPVGTFIMEYVGEVLDYREFKYRVKKYDKENIPHHYFMALNGEEVIDATKMGNVSRFINHCCDPNAETQKWTVGGQLRVGFFTIKPVRKGEELTFNYQFESYGLVLLSINFSFFT